MKKRTTKKGTVQKAVKAKGGSGRANAIFSGAKPIMGTVGEGIGGPEAVTHTGKPRATRKPRKAARKPKGAY